MRVVAVLAALALVNPASVQAKGPSLVQVPATTQAQRAEVASWGMEIVDAEKDSLTIAVQPDRHATPRVLRRLSQIDGVKVVAEDVDELLRHAAQRAGGVGAYHTYETAQQELKDLASRYPALASVQSIGKSIEGRDVGVLKITGSDSAAWGKPVFLFMGCHHAREWISVEVPLAIAHMLLDGYATDASIKKLVDSREIWICPVVNPDGLNWSQTNYRYWRKNRHVNADGTFGVDPNRNYGYKWGVSGDSDEPDSDVYHGTGAFSEPEVQNVRDFATAHLLTADISYHSYGEHVLFPYSYGYDQAPDNDKFAVWAKGMADQNAYLPHQSVDLYPSSGDTDDFLYMGTGSASFTTELARTFIPEDSEIPGICDVNCKAVRYMLDACADPFPYMKHTPPAANAGPLSVTAQFDRAHHPVFNPTEVKLVVTSGNTVQEIPMAADASNPDSYTVNVPGLTGASEPVQYFIGLKDKDGRAVRSPRLGTYTVGGRRALPASNLLQLTGF